MKTPSGNAPPGPWPQEQSGTSADHVDRRSAERTRVPGTAAILEHGYFGLVYEVVDFSWAGARLRGPKRAPGSVFEVLLRISDRFVEYRARVVWDRQSVDGYLGIAFEGSCNPKLLQIPVGLLDSRLGVPVGPKVLASSRKRQAEFRLPDTQIN